MDWAYAIKHGVGRSGDPVYAVEISLPQSYSLAGHKVGYLGLDASGYEVKDNINYACLFDTPIEAKEKAIEGVYVLRKEYNRSSINWSLGSKAEA